MISIMVIQSVSNLRHLVWPAARNRTQTFVEYQWWWRP